MTVRGGPIRNCESGRLFCCAACQEQRIPNCKQLFKASRSVLAPDAFSRR
ncbi:hypothetical protein PLANPX_1316 [Lacipirellula parvula]|uniref:Uncharacterized protein n=1 Tax=Lacipirellula parvula TaxID=2650471 RepID=A0A5K7X4T7_9BACT|nr:hypothetical protein PLANPX_1316 [Lacipirellula parvula]